MIPDRIEQVEADRKKRERELLALLLLMLEETRQHAQSAIKLGVDPVQSAYNVIFGAPHIDQPGFAAEFGNLMALAYIDGESRVAKWADVPLPPMEQKQAGVAREYQAFVQRALESLYEAVAKKIRKAVVDGAEKGIRATMQLVRLNMQAAGLSKGNTSAMELAAEQAIVTSYNAGMWAAYHAPIVAVKLWGFQHWSVLDRGTTEICRERNMLTLRKENGYWLSNFVPLHMRCRSIIAPRFTDQTNIESSTLPTTPPAPGFGQAPPWVRLAAGA